ncbi:hypothetical protein Fmac_004624 [Flemingia macrophylla]|uniref:X8 domain-containing protein n=1 Tax=Flemingia macrophylla TaxID=520843 RepID=A0ABD1N5F5_9FABA
MEVTKVVYFVLLLSIIVGENVEATWCVARSDASYAKMKAGLDYACSHGADCGPIAPGGSCFNPNTIQHHASYAFDSYYQKHGKAPSSCDFDGAGTIAVTDPSFGSCKYPPYSVLQHFS